MSKNWIGTYEIEDKELGFKGFISLNSLRDGLAFGGCRISPNVTREEVEMLAYCMNLKLAAHGFPVGGAKGGIQINPASPMLGKSLTAFAHGMKDLLTKHVILGKDLGASTEMLDSIYDALKIPQMHITMNGPNAARVPNRLRDMNGYQSNMTGLGVAIAARQALHGDIKNKYVMIQGAGAVGVGAAVRFNEMGAIIRAISDVEHCVFRKEGIKLSTFADFIENGRINVEKAEAMGLTVAPSNDMFAYDADLLVLAAASHSVQATHANQVRCATVVEGSNFGLVPAARKTLFQRGIPVVPDVIASSSSAAMVAHQMASRNGYTHEQLWQMIIPAIENAVAKSAEAAKAERVDMRDAYVELFAQTKLAKSS